MPSLINQQFIKAAQNNQIDELKNLLDRGADIHANDDEALKLSAEHGHLEVVKFLVAQMANIYADDDALGWAAGNGHLEIVKFLLSQGANIHADDDCALKRSAFKGHLEVVKFLVKKGADIHANNDESLRWAANRGHLETVKFLLTRGANVQANDNEALKESARNGHDDVWRVLSAFIQEEKLVVAALGSGPVLPGASTWVSGTEVDVTSASTWISAPEVTPVALVAASGDILQTQRVKFKKSQRSKI